MNATVCLLIIAIELRTHYAFAEVLKTRFYAYFIKRQYQHEGIKFVESISVEPRSRT